MALSRNGRDDSDQSRVIIVSSDSHGGLPPELYRPYFDPQYREALDDHISDVASLREPLALVGFPYPDSVLELIDERGAIRGGGAEGAYNATRRLVEAEDEGVVAEVIHPGTQHYGPAPFYEIMCSRYSPELRAAGARAYNRWLAEFCSADVDRLIGVALTEPWPDMNAAVDQLVQARDTGFGGIWTDQYAGLDEEAPGVWDRSWDPFWSACVELELAVHFHIGFGIPQGTPQTIMREFMKMVQESGDAQAIADAGSDLFDNIFSSRRPLWQLMWGGVLDRYPTLKVVFAEQHAGWLPPTLNYLDGVYTNAAGPLTMKPSDYWRKRDFAVTCTSIRPSDLDGRDEIGVAKIMFGTDFPHMEGTWPNTQLWLGEALAGLKEADVRAILGENAIRFYGLDREKLGKVANRVGPTTDQIVAPRDPVDPELLEQFHRRSGFNKGPLVSFDESELRVAVEEDIKMALADS